MTCVLCIIDLFGMNCTYDICTYIVYIFCNCIAGERTTFENYKRLVRVTITIKYYSLQ